MNLDRVAGRNAEPASAPSPASRPRVIAVNRFFWPDHAATSQILSDLTWFLASRKWRVSVVTSRLRYDDPHERLAASEAKDGVRIRRVWTSRMGRDRLPGRALDYLTFYVSAGAALLGEAKRGDVILVTTDPPLFSVVAAWLARLKGARLVTWNHDVFPELAEALGMFRAGNRAGRLLAGLRNRALRRATINVALSEEMADRLAQAGAERASLRVVPNWSDSGIHPVAPAENRLRREWGLGDGFVIGYSGNLGRAHMPEKVAELVRRTRDIPGLSWLFIGGGGGMERIRAIARESDAPNLQIRPYQKRAELALSLSAPDAHLVSVDPVCEGLVVPSKISGICAAGRPIIYLGNPRSALARHVLDEGIGLCLDPEAPDSWRRAIEGLQADPARLLSMGRRAWAKGEAGRPEQRLLHWEAVLSEAADADGIAEGRA